MYVHDGLFHSLMVNVFRLRTINVFSNFSVISMESLKESDFVYPFLAEVNTEKIFGFHFIPMMDAPSVYYITKKKISPRETLMALIRLAIPVNLISFSFNFPRASRMYTLP